MAHVDNVVQAALLAATHSAAPAGQVFIVADEKDYSTMELEIAMREALGRRPPVMRVPFWLLACLARAGDLAGRVLRRRVGFDSDSLEKLLGSARFDASRLRRELGYQPRADLRAGLAEMVAELTAGSGRASATVPVKSREADR